MQLLPKCIPSLVYCNPLVVQEWDSVLGITLGQPVGLAAAGALASANPLLLQVCEGQLAAFHDLDDQLPVGGPAHVGFVPFLHLGEVSPPGCGCACHPSIGGCWPSCIGTTA